jgi:hypothetical protein
MRVRQLQELRHRPTSTHIQGSRIDRHGMLTIERDVRSSRRKLKKSSVLQTKRRKRVKNVGGRMNRDAFAIRRNREKSGMPKSDRNKSDADSRTKLVGGKRKYA